MTVEVQTGFNLVKVELKDDVLATCDFDRQQNAIRMSELAVAMAFAQHRKSQEADK